MAQPTVEGRASTSHDIAKSRGHWHRETHIRHRDYSPTLGRFIERDPMGFEAGDNNWYRFVANGSTNSTDPLGLEAIDGGDAAAGGGVGTQVLIHGKTLVNIRGTAMYVSGVPAAEMRVPKKGTTSVLFIYKKSDPNKLYRLDYDTLTEGPRVGQKGWEHNQKGVSKILRLEEAGIRNEKPCGPLGKAAGRAITLFRHGGKALIVAGAISTGVELWHAEDKAKIVVREIGVWGGAWAGARIGAYAGGVAAGIGGQAGLQAALPEEVVTVPVAVFVGGILGGIAGAWAGGTATETIYERVYTLMEAEEWIVAEDECEAPGDSTP